MWTLVTGGAKNLGGALSLHLAKENKPVIIHYNESKDQALNLLDECLKFEPRCAIIQGDFSSKETTDDFIKRYLDQFENTSNIINNVGNYFLGSFSDTPEKIFYDLYQTNFHAPCALIRSFLPSIIRNEGSIINIGTSGINDLRADTYSAAYRMTKSTLFILTKTLAKELSTKNVKVNMISPGYLEKSVDYGEIPMGRPTKYEEVGNLVSYLLSRKVETITGQNIEIAGGVRL